MNGLDQTWYLANTFLLLFDDKILKPDPSSTASLNRVSKSIEFFEFFVRDELIVIGVRSAHLINNNSAKKKKKISLYTSVVELPHRHIYWIKYEFIQSPMLSQLVFVLKFEVLKFFHTKDNVAAGK